MTCFSRALVSVNEDMPRSYRPFGRPGMIESNVTFLTSTFRPSSLADRVRQIGVHADDGGAVGGEELVRRVRRVRRHGERALALDGGRDECGGGRVDAGRRSMRRRSTLVGVTVWLPPDELLPQAAAAPIVRASTPAEMTGRRRTDRMWTPCWWALAADCAPACGRETRETPCDKIATYRVIPARQADRGARRRRLTGARRFRIRPPCGGTVGTPR